MPRRHCNAPTSCTQAQGIHHCHTDYAPEQGIRIHRASYVQAQGIHSCHTSCTQAQGIHHCHTDYAPEQGIRIHRASYVQAQGIRFCHTSCTQSQGNRCRLISRCVAQLGGSDVVGTTHDRPKQESPDPYTMMITYLMPACAPVSRRGDAHTSSWPS
jgi:hypothetical protein